MQVFTSMADKRLTELIAAGAVGVLPTDTVYGLVASATSQQAVARLYALKQREHKPGTVIAATFEQLIALGLKARYLKAVEQFWPGPVSVLIPGGPELNYLHLGKFSLAVRIPNDNALSQLVTKVGPLLSSSANQPSEPTATTVKAAQVYFGDKLDFYVDGGDLSGREPSTIIRIVDDAIEIIRQGAIKINEAGRIEK